MSRMVAPANGASSAYVDDYWQHLTDEELEKVVWFTTDPMGLENIQPTIPETLGEFEIELEYRLDLGDRPVPCAHCPQHTPHRHGFVLKTAEGTRFLLGSVCGPKAYGSDYRLASRARTEMLKRYEALVRWKRAKEHLLDYIWALAEAEKSADFRAVGRAREALEKSTPGLLERLRTLRPNTLMGTIELSALVRSRDVDAEAKRDRSWQAAIEEISSLPNKEHRRRHAELSAQFRPNEPIFVEEDRQLGALQGWRWLFDATSPTKQISDITQRLRAIYSLGKTTQDKKRSQIEAFAKGVERDLELAKAALLIIREAGAFFSAENLERVVTWWTSVVHHNDRLTASGRELRVLGPIEVTGIGLWTNWSPPGQQFIDLYRP